MWYQHITHEISICQFITNTYNYLITVLQNRHEADIVKVLDHFKSTGQVMRVVLEACVFRKKYFVDTFLKTLMSSRLADDQLQNSFIEKLNSMNKIPTSMYNKWIQEQI